jgi:hypothetical protein
MSDYDMTTMRIESSSVFFRRLTYALFIVWVVYGMYLFFMEDWWSVSLLMVFIAFAISFVVYRTLKIISDARIKRFCRPRPHLTFALIKKCGTRYR